VQYGKGLWSSGISYGKYAEIINALVARRREARRSFTRAWDLAFAWKDMEPTTHRVACPLIVVEALAVQALFWGWPLVAVHLLIGWHGIMRPVEHLAAVRGLLTLPCDSARTHGPVFLRIPFPKNRRSGPRQQTARWDDDVTTQLTTSLFASWPRSARLWPLSLGAFRRRFDALCAALHLRHGRDQCRGADWNAFSLTLGAMRPGGATAL
jgi:hypothetical protein